MVGDLVRPFDDPSNRRFGVLEEVARLFVHGIRPQPTGVALLTGLMTTFVSEPLAEA